jgi:hypothetical protein
MVTRSRLPANALDLVKSAAGDQWAISCVSKGDTQSAGSPPVPVALPHVPSRPASGDQIRAAMNHEHRRVRWNDRATWVGSGKEKLLAVVVCLFLLNVSLAHARNRPFLVKDISPNTSELVSPLNLTFVDGVLYYITYDGRYYATRRWPTPN